METGCHARKENRTLKTGSITVGLRETVTVCLMVNGKEVRCYRNTELPDIVKEAEMDSFHFNIHMDGRITFYIAVMRSGV